MVTDKDGETWYRCPFCGDSPNSQKMHFSVNPQGLYHCFRCGVGGRLTSKEYLALVSTGSNTGTQGNEPLRANTGSYTVDDTLDELLPGAATRRFSSLDRYHLEPNWDAFLSRNTQGSTVGLVLISVPTPGEKRVRKVLGQRCLGWRGDVLLSSPAQPLRVVEGPYDCLDDRHVCLFGLPDPHNLRFLLGHYVILCPDGDVWGDAGMLRNLVNLIWPKYHRPGPEILGVEKLPDGLDPDQVPVTGREFLTKEALLQWLDSTSVRPSGLSRDRLVLERLTS